VNFCDYSVFLCLSFQHLKQDRVSIFALQDASSSLKETLQNPKSSIEDRALSRFSHQSFIQLEVNKYREKNPHWKLQIPVLLEKSKEKRKQIDKKLKEREAAKLAKKEPNTKKAAEELEVIQKDSSSEDEESDEEGESSSSEVEEKKKVDIADDDDKVQLPRTVVVQKSLSLLEKTPLEKQPKKKASLLAKAKPPAVVVKPQLEKSKGTIRVQVLHNLSDIEQESIIIPSAPQPTDIKLTAEDPDKVSRKRPKSSFFVGGVDEEEEPEDQERRHQPQRQRQFQSSSSFSGPPAEFKPIFRKGKLVNKGPKRFTKSQPQDRRRPKERYFDSSSEQFGGSSNLTPLGDNKKEGNNNKTKQFVKSSKSLLSNPAAANSEHSSGGDKLHPSWEAKKRQQISLSSFKGKKITFDD
jgi:hypothetical protein